MLDEIEAGSVVEDTSAVEVEEVETDHPEAKAEVPEREADEAETSEADEAEDGDQPEGDDPEEVASTDDLIEVEYDGRVHKVPSELKDALMLTKDYTHKTQALAESRKAFEAEQSDFRQYVEASRAHSDAIAQVAALDMQLAQFEAYDWNAAYDADLAGATKLRHQMEQLGQQRQALVESINTAETERQRLYQEKLTKTAAKTDQQLKGEIPNWGDGLKSELGTFAVEAMGFDPQMVSRAVTPQEIKTLYYAQVGYKAIKAAEAKKADAVKPKEAKPPKKVQPRRQKAPTDLSKISDPEEYRKAYLARKRKQGT